MSKKRKTYTPAEKAKIALEAIKGALTLAQISSKYGAHGTQINAWKKQALALLPDIFSDKSKQEVIFLITILDIGFSLHYTAHEF